MKSTFKKGEREAEAWNKRKELARQSWINNVKKIYGWSQEMAEKEWKKINNAE